MEAKQHTGSCHCGAVRFTVVVDTSKGGRCNCTICTKAPQTSAMVKPDALVVVAGESNLATYEWGTRTSKRYFCKTCGVHCFGRGHLAQLGGDYAAVNLNCVDDLDPRDVVVGFMDGRHNNWMAGVRDTPWPVFP